MAFFALIAILVGMPAISLSSEGSTTLPSSSSARATLKLVAFDPVTVAGRGFMPRERVQLRADGLRKSVIAGARGGFKVTFRGANACGGVAVAAVGSDGSRASLSFAFNNVHCLEPLESTSAFTQAAKPAMRIVAYRPLTVRGDAFKSGERVRLIALGSLQRVSRTISASENGSFRASFTRLGADRCSLLVVAAVGSMGSRASAKVVHRPCNPPRVPPPRD